MQIENKKLFCKNEFVVHILYFLAVVGYYNIIWFLFTSYGVENYFD